ncbi:MAG TPA: sigma-70 family RNA polymerase sigma factor [Planctomicrobium sp.]|nr:sigma-70 family RNA polymerase sigma factor [Planctomicrobium sp.]
MNHHIPGLSSGSHLDFVHLWTKSARRVHAYLLVLVMNWSDAEDLLQEVAATAWEKFPEYDSSRDFLAWVNGIARHKALNSRRKTALSLELTPELAELLEQEIASEAGTLTRQLALLQQCVSGLRKKDRDLLQLRYAPDSTMETVARRIGRSVAACYKAIQRIHNQLFACITVKLSRGEP